MTGSTNPQVDQLVRDGIEAFKAGDKQLARGKLEAAVKIDSYSEQAWFWLARVVDTDEERRTCLGNVILINPNNTRAQQMLDKLESRGIQPRGEGSQRGRRGGSRLRLYLLVGGVGLVLLLLVAFAALSGGGGEEVVVPTPFITNTPSPTPDVNMTQTAQASITPSVTPTPSFTPGLAPTWTPTPGPTETPPPEQLPPPPSDVPGRIIMQSGRVAGDDANQPIVVVSPSDLSTKMTVSAEGQRGQLPALVSGLNRFVWAQYSSGTRSLTLQIQNFGVEDSTNIVTLYNNDPVLAAPTHPTWHRNKLAFSATLLGAELPDLWLLTLSEEMLSPSVPAFGSQAQPSPTPAETLDPTLLPPPLVRLTSDSSGNTWPAFDPTGTALVYVAVTDGITELRVVNVNSLQIFELTKNGNALIESAPDWSPANEIVFSAAANGAETTDLYLMNADGLAEPTLLLDFGEQDIQPRFSPDGRYVVFSSNRNGNWDVFIYDRETEAVYGLETNPQTIDIANDWTE